jgi:hypothetical protein
MGTIPHSIHCGFSNPFIWANHFTVPEKSSDQALLDKYQLKSNDAILAEERHLPLYDEIVTKYSAKYLAGGAAQNAARGAQVRAPFAN